MTKLRDDSPDWKGYGWDQIAVEKLVRGKWGDKAFENAKERASRLAEESLELLQAVGCDREVAHKIVDMVFDRKPGSEHQEVAGIAVSLLAFSALRGLRLDDVVNEEIDRLNPIDPKVLKDRHIAKALLGVAMRVE